MCSIIQSQFWTVVAIPLGITLVGAFFGAWLGMKFFNRQASEEFKKERADILKALLQSLEDNHKYIKQIEEVHFPNNQFPSYPMDTEALSFLALNARKYLDKDRNWSQELNKLRFELDHVNRKVLMTYIHPTEEDFNGLKSIIKETRTNLDEKIKELKKLA